MARDNRDVEEEEKEVSVEKLITGADVAMTEEAKNTVAKFVKDMSKAPAGKQLGVGAAAGWISGYLVMKVGKYLIRLLDKSNEQRL